MGAENAPTPRQGHMLRKSRSGCHDCRLRKVKCDEVKPVCSNCRRRYVGIQRCASGMDARSDIHSSRSRKRAMLRQSSENGVVEHISAYDKGEPIRSLAPHPSSISGSGQWRTLELRLMHHYTSVVCHVMPNCKGASAWAWQHIIPQLSFESEVVLNPMLALSALHLHAHSPTDSAMAVALRRYLDRTLANHRQALSSPGKGLTEPLWLSAVLITHLYWLLAHQRQPNETYELPLQVIKMLDGVGVVFVQNKSFLARLGYGSYEYDHMPQVSLRKQLSIGAQVQLQSITDDLACLLDAFGVPELTEDIKDVYIGTKDYVLSQYGAFFLGVSATTLQRFVVTMAVRCHPGYRALLESYDPLAMALMARMLVLLTGLDHAWWASGNGDYEVVERDVQGIRHLMPADLRWSMDWPCAVLKGEISLDRDK
ncbi:hypothetical protein B0J13DRAFT_37215 [Dactylonectria estremocensis]|uniref:Zn(2)-C6 fungal-type domain-containing protein n=1 Tax=Dactylonectria estremocensis TaxID=1079267 RepID=A0A9P9JF93_9HYPO|nr:hypothetical protein B0J13DRAFT_37215 [Dactylonectria estremocensis]